MSVYVDPSRYPFHNMIMCHMIADTPEELREMARRIGVQVKWVEYPGTYKEHFDIAKGKRAQAVKCGAIEVTAEELSEMVMERKRRAAIDGEVSSMREQT